MFSRIDIAQRTRTSPARRMVIKDAQAMAAIWTEQQQTGPLPNVDFSKQMVIMSERIMNRTTPGTPAPSAATASVVLLDRSGEPVEFVTQQLQYR